MASSSKQRRYTCTFTNALQAKFPIMKTGRDSTEVLCSVCSNYVNIKHRGAADIEKHISTEKHKKNLSVVSNSTKIDSLFASQSSGYTTKKSAAEATLAFHTVKHHQSFKSMDCSSPLMKVLFADSNTANSISCARTKTEAIVTGVISPWIIRQVKISLQNINYLGVSTDASNHGAEKIFPIMIQFFDWQEGIKTKLLEVLSTPNETADTITEIIETTLQKHDLLEKCVSFTADNANVNFGGVNRQPGKNVWTNLKNILEKEIVGVGCPAHILHNCIQQGTDNLHIDIESIVMKLFNYFSVYTVRTEALKDISEYIDVNYQKLLYHSKTRWLSLFPAIERILKMFEPLKQYFLSSSDRGVPVTLKNFFENELSEVYLFFAHSLMSVFQTRIQDMEKEKNSVLDVIRILESTNEILVARADANFMPLKVKEMLVKCTEENREILTTDVKNMYQTCIEYLVKWIKPLEEFKVFEWFRLKKGEIINFDEVATSIQYLNGKGVRIDDVILFDEIAVLNSFICKQEDEFFDGMLHVLWSRIFKTIGFARLPELLRISQYIFAITAQNSNVERVFSMMGGQWSKERNRLTVSSVRALLLIQYNLKDVTCEEFYKTIIKDKSLLDQVSGTSKYL